MKLVWLGVWQERGPVAVAWAGGPRMSGQSGIRPRAGSVWKRWLSVLLCYRHRRAAMAARWRFWPVLRRRENCSWSAYWTEGVWKPGGSGALP